MNLLRKESKGQFLNTAESELQGEGFLLCFAYGSANFMILTFWYRCLIACSLQFSVDVYFSLILQLLFQSRIFGRSLLEV